MILYICTKMRIKLNVTGKSGCLQMYINSTSLHREKLMLLLNYKWESSPIHIISLWTFAERSLSNLTIMHKLVLDKYCSIWIRKSQSRQRMISEPLTYMLKNLDHSFQDFEVSKYTRVGNIFQFIKIIYYIKFIYI